MTAKEIVYPAPIQKQDLKVFEVHSYPDAFCNSFLFHFTKKSSRGEAILI